MVLSSITLSSVQQIQDKVGRQVEQFSFIDILGSMVNNEEFGAGFNEMLQNPVETKRSFVWKALSAVGQEFGQTLYENVLNYIDNVSNIDLCRVKSLKSMMKMLDVDYQVLEKIDYYPIEIQSLIDIFSINKKYLFNNKFIKQDFIDALSTDGYITLDEEEEPRVLSNEGDISSTINHYLYQDGTFNNYLSSVYNNFIYDMLDQDFKVSEIPLAKVRDKIEEDDGYLNPPTDRYLKEKKQNNINPAFDVIGIVDSIEIGQDLTSNYNGPELSLILDEIEYRKAPLQQLSSYSNQTRYSYYKKQKVISYAKFVDDAYVEKDKVLEMTKYEYDENYFLTEDYQQKKHVLQDIGSGASTIDDKMVETVACTLVQITNYISKLRELLRFQVRKVYMKGTNNLLEYTANEFIIDYIDYLRRNISEENISGIISKLSAHNIADTIIQEYWDPTEYMNLSTDTSKYAYNAKKINKRFFDETFKRDNDGKLYPYQSPAYFTNEEINEFYLSTLVLKNTLEPAISSETFLQKQSLLSSNFYEFLSVLFDVAADPSFYDEEFKIFGTKLSNSIITRERNEDLLEVSAINDYLSSMLDKSGYQFSADMEIADQLDGFKRSVQDYLSVQYLSSVSATYFNYIPVVEEIGTEFSQLKDDLSVCLHQKYDYYFCKSDNTYCYDEDGNYLFDYFVGNSNYPEDDYYITHLNDAYSWINDGHCQTWPVLCATQRLRQEYSNTSSDIHLQIVDYIALSGYNDLNLENLDEEMNSIKEFLNQKITDRNTYLQTALGNFRTQASALKAAYDQLANTFSQVLAQAPDTSQGWYITYNQSKTGNYAKVEGGGENNSYDQFSQHFFKYTQDGKQWFDAVNFKSSNTITDADTLETKANKLIGRLAECSNIFYGFVKGASSAVATKSYGTQKDTLNSILADLKGLNVSFNSIVDQVQALYQLDDAKVAALKHTSDSSADINQKIVDLIAFLGTKVSEVEFSKDLIIADYNSYLIKLTDISVAYLPSRSEYENLWIMFNNFFEDYQKPVDYKVFTDRNLIKIQSFTNTKDKKALKEINAWFDDAFISYEVLVNKFIDFCQNGIHLYDGKREYLYEYTGDVLEECLIDLTEKLLLDISARIADGLKKIEDDLDYLDSKISRITSGDGLYRKYFHDELGTFAKDSEFEAALLKLTVSFMDLVAKLIDELDYNKSKMFNSSKTLFQNYTGLSFVADDPYYNHKNQTHPSYQVHPFLWNFIEKNLVDSAIDSISEIITSIDNSDLEGEAAQYYIDQYLGQFGQLIDVWKHGVPDLTGYRTRYETSNHLCRYTDVFSEVVDYDGAFYPPALKQYLDGKTAVEDLDAYYKHLNMSDDDKSAFTTKLRESFDKIQEMTLPASESMVWDIYKYQIDKFGNIFILFKQYGKADATCEEKLETDGQLWVRLADTPIAMPIGKCILESASYKGLADMLVCDMEILPCGSKMVITYRDRSYGVMRTIPLYVDYQIHGSTGVGDLVISDSNPLSLSIYQTRVIPQDLFNGTKTEHQATEFFKYVGCYSRNDTTVDVIYQLNKCELDADDKVIDLGSEEDSPTIVVNTISQDKVYENQNQYRLTDVRGIVYPKQNPVFSYFIDLNGMKYLELAYLTEQEETSLSAYKRRGVDISSDTEGKIFADPVNKEMNSFDVFTQNISIVKIKLTNPTIESTSTFNTNADIGYIPAYTGTTDDRLLDLRDDIPSCYQAVELLGQSKNIDNLIGAVNPSPNPYLTKEEIYNNNLFGRVYENGVGTLSDDQFDISKDNTLNIYSNKVLYPNMPQDATVSYLNGSYYWSVMLTEGEARYVDSDLSNLKVFIYNTETLGRNPYLIIDLSTAVDESKKLGDDEWLSVNYNLTSDFETTGFQASIHGQKIVVSGVQNGVNQIDTNYSNGIYNIKNFQYKYIESGAGGTTKKLQLKLDVEDPSTPSYIKQDSIKVALINQYDLTFFQWYHYLDPGVTYEEYKTALNNISGTPLSKEDLLKLDLSQFSYLSDVQINGLRLFETNKRLSFKVSEQDIFPLSSINYYIPSLNVKYPYSFGQFYNDTFVARFDVDASAMVQIFMSAETFQLEVQNKEKLSSFGDVDINSNFDAVDDYRVFEDYLSVDAAGNPNSTKYHIEDPLFFQFARFAGDNSPASLEVGPEYYANVRVGKDDKFSQYLQTQGLVATRSEANLDGSYTSFKFNFELLDDEQQKKFINDLKKFLKLHIAYKKEAEGITLYVNYQNYINSPFVKLENGKAYVDIVDKTYALIKPGCSEQVNVILQFKYYIDDDLAGYKNVIMATYKIYNISDDKPKFVIKRVLEVVPNDGRAEEDKTVTIEAQKYIGSSSSTKFDYSVQMRSQVALSSDVTVSMIYPPNLLEVTDFDSNYVTKCSDGWLRYKFTNTVRKQVIKFQMKSQMQQKIGKTNTITLLDGKVEDGCTLKLVNGYVKIV